MAHQATAKPKNDKEESEENRVRRLNANKVKEDLKKKSPEEKREWYLDQKASRAAEDQKKKRTFSSAVEHVEEGREAAVIKDDVNAYIRWAATEMSMKVYNTLAEADSRSCNSLHKEEWGDLGAGNSRRRGPGPADSSSSHRHLPANGHRIPG